MRWLITIAFITLAGGALAQDGWRLETSSAQWNQRQSHIAVTFNNKFWIMKGDAGATPLHTNDAWSSSDGVNWNEELSSFPWPDTHGGVSVVFNGEMWFLGGSNTGVWTNQVWRSPDGVNWTQEADGPWLERANFACVEFNGKLWVFGGWTKQQTYQSLLNDVWSTTDGVNWTQEVAAAAWSPRNAHTATVFNNRMWIMGGGDNQGITNDVWSSSDGVNWVQETSNAPWGPRLEHNTVVYRDRLWVIGGIWSDGISTIRYTDVWSSADGVNWVEETDGAPWGEGERVRHASTVFNNRIWVTGGGTTTTGHMNDVWSYGLHIAPDVLPDAEEVQPYNADFEARVGDGPFIWTLSGGSLPPGLTLDTSSTGVTTSITGTPLAAGDYTFTIQLEDTDGNVIEQDYTLTVHPRPPLNSNNSSGNSGCTARSTSSGQARATGSGLARSAGSRLGGMPWVLLLGALTLIAAAVLRRRVGSISRTCP